LVVAPLMVTGRTERVQQVLVERELDALIVTDPIDIRWLTGFSGSAGTLVVNRLDSTVITDGRYAHQARYQIASSGGTTHVLEARTAASGAETLLQVVGTRQRVGMDLDRTTARVHEHVRGSGVTVIDAASILAELRRIKDEAELERIERACWAADNALSAVAPMLHAVSSLTERDVRDELEYHMRRAGADGPSYDTIVAAGENAAFPHHRPSERRIVEGDCILIDVGALVDGYHSDMTRTFLLGEVDPELRRMYDAVARVQEAGRAGIRAGVTGESIDMLCRQAFGDDADLFVHGTGHGVGLHIHESPWLRSGWDRPLQSGEVVTVEPGLYRVGLGGVRIEDLVVVEPTGCRTLTHSPKYS
jgi:Xaa-Pro aminopeptidase